MSRVARAALGICAAAIALAATACGESGSEDPRLVILYAPCTVNKNFLSPYQPSLAFTPNLARFSERERQAVLNGLLFH